MTISNKTILVLGATGQQGSAVVRTLRADGWEVRAFTRDPLSTAAQKLVQTGAQLVSGDMNERASLDSAIQGVYGIFSVQPPDWSPEDTADSVEYHMGKKVADAAKVAGVQHFVYSSVGGAEEQSRFRNIAKWEIEQYIHELKLPATILRPASFMENYLDQRFGIQNGVLAEATEPGVEIKLIAVEDIGAFAALAFRKPDLFLGKTIEIAGDSLTPPEIAAAISSAVGVSIPYVQIPLETIRQKNEVLASIYQWLNNEGYYVDFATLRKWRPSLINFNAWLENKGAAEIVALFRTNNNELP
ncbi:NmrA/HSCARG family protein [Bacillus gobiensis]|uniref:NmrA/HSCARG family protein n=1 Tax=Bacillus gobiensis TaxID=1441095 RepID=UPI003D1C234D